MLAHIKLSKIVSDAQCRIIFIYTVLVLGIFSLPGLSSGYSRDHDGDRVVAHLRRTPITVYTYRPKGCEVSALLFVFHGIDRDPLSYRNSAREFADQSCMIVFAPHLDEERFPAWKYQRGGVIRGQHVQPRDQWTVALVPDLIRWARFREGKPKIPYYLFGHSAGAQFLSRVAAFYPPLDALKIVIANPSTYVLPSTSEAAPYGLGGVFSPAEEEERLKAYLELPITIYLGKNDTGDKNLLKSPTAVRQGATRLERGYFTFNLAKSTALAKGWDLRWRLVVAKGVGHSAKEMLGADTVAEAFSLEDSDMAR